MNPLVTLKLKDFDEEKFLREVPYAKEVLAKAEEVRAKAAFNEKRPSISGVHLNGDKVHLEGWPSDWAFTSAITRVLRGTGVKVPQLIGACGVALILMVEGKMVLQRRSPNVAVNPNTWAAGVNEGITFDDYEGAGSERTLDVRSVAARGALEELGGAH